MTTVGYGDISSGNRPEFILNICLKLAGVVLFSLVQSFIFHMVEDIKQNSQIAENKIQ